MGKKVEVEVIPLVKVKVILILHQLMPDFYSKAIKVKFEVIPPGGGLLVGGNEAMGNLWDKLVEWEGKVRFSHKT